MFKDRYKQLYDPIHAEDELIERVLESAKERGREGRGRHRRTLAAAVAACLCLCLWLTVPAVASNVEPVYQLLYSVLPGAAQSFMPVQKSDEDNGIRLEVISAYIHENKAEIYVGLQDLTGNRIDETVDLLDSYSIHRPFDSSATCSLVGYDKSTRAATFLISIEEWGGRKIEGDKITFSVREFLSRKKTFEAVKIPINLAVAEQADQMEGRTEAVSSTGGGGPDYETEMMDKDDALALVPMMAMDELQVEGIEMTGIGYIDGKLHVQTAVRDSLSNDNHGFLYLQDAAGNKVDSSYSFSFCNREEGASRTDYNEFVFNISKEEAGQYQLFGDFKTSSMLTKGDWRITFPLEAAGGK